jgi:hypothetical protein
MSLRYRRRVNLGNGHGLNVSGSGVSYSKRTSWGSVGTRGFSLRTGIPGLYFYQPWSRKRKKNETGIVFLLLLLYFALIAAVQIVFWVFRFLIWLFEQSTSRINKKQLQLQAQKEYALWGKLADYGFFKFNEITLPAGIGEKSVKIETLFYADGAFVQEGEDLCSVVFDDKHQGTIPSLKTGTLKWYVGAGDTLNKNDFVFHIHQKK